MGVKGLFSLLNGKREISPDIEFRDSMLLVDGSNLVYQMYFTSNLDQNHGGEFLAFKVHVQAFFNTLADCGIKPYVVMDGTSSDIQLDTIMDRDRNMVQRAHDAAETGCKKGIIPTLTKLVFQQTLSDMKVPLVKCFREADCELAALASEWRCPVLSNDSDFCIYDLPAGFLPMDHFKWLGVRTSDGKSYIPCKQYTTTRFCKSFKIDHQLLPVFASLAGNNSLASGKKQWTQFLPPERQEEMSWQADLEGLLVWLRRFRTPEETMTALMKLRPNMSQEEQTKVRMAMLQYRLPNSYLQAFFTEGTIPSLPDDMLRIVPDWFRAPLARGDLSGKILDVLVLGLNKLHTKVEHSDRPSSNLISQPIREALYGLLLGQGGEMVQEVDRDGLHLASVMVKPVVQGAALKLTLNSLPQADQAVRLQVCLETLGVEETTLEGVPAHLRLPVAVTRYWQRRDKPDQMLLKALLMVMVQGELKRQRGLTTGWQGDTIHINEPLDPVVAHSFNQWQACLMDASKLNQLLCTPLPQPHYAWLFQGRLVHQRMRELQEGTLEVHSAVFTVQDQNLLKAVLQPDPGARGRTGGPEAQLTHPKYHRHLNNQEEEEEEMDQGLDSPKVSVKTRYRTKKRKDRSRNSELWRKKDREEWE